GIIRKTYFSRMGGFRHHDHRLLTSHFSLLTSSLPSLSHSHSLRSSHCIHNSPQEMASEIRFSERFISMSAAGIKGAASVEFAVPGDGVPGAILSSFVAGLI